VDIRRIRGITQEVILCVFDRKDLWKEIYFYDVLRGVN